MKKFIGIIISIVAIGAAAYVGWLLIYPVDRGVSLPAVEDGADVVVPISLPPTAYPQESAPVQKTMMQLTSAAFENEGSIPAKYTCDGSNINPSFEISGIPESAKTLALIMDDHDVPLSVRADGVWDHWVVFNISPETTLLREGKKAPGVYGVGTNNKTSYLGPCPPDREHRYSFRLYALDTILELTAGATKSQVIAAMQGHVIEKTELIGRYERR